MTTSPDLSPVHQPDRRMAGSRLELQLPMLLALVPLGLALMPDQTAVSRASWVLLSCALATAFGAIGERRRQRRIVMRNAFALSIVAFGVLAGLMVRESATPTFAALEPVSPTTAAPTSVPAEQAPSVQGKTATAEDDLDECHAALRNAERALRPVAVDGPTPTSAAPAADQRTVVEQREACRDLVTYLDAAIRQSGAMEP